MGKQLAAEATSPEASADWDAVAELWQRAPAQTLWRRHSDSVNTRLVQRWLPAGTAATLKTDLWDEAMGEGLYPAIAARTDRVVGVDVSPSIVAAAAARYPTLDARVAHVHALPFEDGAFDAIVSNSTLDHFDHASEIDSSIVELARVLRPAGTLLLTLDNPANPVVALAKVLPRDALNRLWLRWADASTRIGLLPYHVGATYGRSRLCSVLRTAGFAVEETTAIVHAPRAVAVVVGQRVRDGSRFLRVLWALEQLERAPTRFLTGHFVAVRARRLA
ncbi:MAG: class I SAM-dependent methyltransferase [Actinomycetota bacterium]|nr:class I SAM-dependent methyltransferase [Actinomycetota bacterium]